VKGLISSSLFKIGLSSKPALVKKNVKVVTASNKIKKVVTRSSLDSDLDKGSVTQYDRGLLKVSIRDIELKKLHTNLKTNIIIS
jgi:hypothetical protein